MAIHFVESAVSDAPIVRIRSIKVADAMLIREFVRSLSLKTRYLRFATSSGSVCSRSSV